MVMVQEKSNQLLYQAAFPDEKVLITQAPALQLRSHGMHAGQYYGEAAQLLSKDMLSLEEEEIFLTLEVYWESKKHLPQVKLALVISRKFLNKLLLSLHKEHQASSDM
ncbi:Putative phospholipid-transporting ATPase IK [Myotis davidii]|uniref:Putative phospholipid-transporting ATPase IK n=1 Tax=Myotis davidii TaxID=225400 RepID=L5MFX7_MYODS|nr:Putative phospholipid-transporting ATPase IK [Myotis davidii]